MSEGETDGSTVVRGFMEHSPHGRELGIELSALEPDRAELTLPFREGLATYGDVIHGGVITTLADTAAFAAAWSGTEVSETPRGATVSLSIDFLRAAKGCNLRAVAKVVRRGKQMCFCEIDVSEVGGELVAKALVAYKLD
jgi:uncharacterized protein (TIGR00369 family)